MKRRAQGFHHDAWSFACDFPDSSLPRSRCRPLAQKKYDPGVTDTEIKIGNTIPYSGPAPPTGSSARPSPRTSR